MTYRVELADSAEADAEVAYLWLRAHFPDTAARWFNGLYAAIDTLSKLPLRCPLAPEAAEIGMPLRQLLYGRRPHVYRVLFLVRRKTIYVLHVRHGARDRLHADDIVIPPETEQ